MASQPAAIASSRIISSSGSGRNGRPHALPSGHSCQSRRAPAFRNVLQVAVKRRIRRAAPVRKRCRASSAYRMSRDSTFIAWSASAYFTPHVLPRYRAMASLVCWAPSSSPGFLGSFRTKAMSLPSHSMACGQTPVTSTNVSGSKPIVWRGPFHGD